MATTFEQRQDTKTAVLDRAAVEHNAQIKERYQRLKSMEEAQFAQMSTQETRASVLAPERPAQTQSPVQQVEARTPVMTVETLERTIKDHVSAPVREMPVVEVAPVRELTTSAQAEGVQGVQLSRFAKVFLGACAAVVTVMICLICAFTQIINANQMKIGAMEIRNAQLQEEYSLVMEELAEAQSPEVIEEFAKEHGLVKVF